MKEKSGYVRATGPLITNKPMKTIDEIEAMAADAAKQIAKNHGQSFPEYDWDDCEIIKYACQKAFVLGRKGPIKPLEATANRTGGELRASVPS
jgi:hypothetical protein